MNTRRAILSVIFIAVMAAWGTSFGQEAEPPFFAEQTTPPNVMIMIDSSGSMGWAGESGSNPRSRMHVVRDVLTGTGEIQVSYSGSAVYVPHTDTTTEGEYYVAGDLGDPLVHIVRVNSSYYCDPSGEYFFFYAPADVAKHDPEATNALTTLDAYLRDMDMSCVSFLFDHDVNDEGIGGTRELYTASDVCTGNGNYTMSEAWADYYYYEEMGTTSGTTIYVVPVSYVSANRYADWWDASSSQWREGTCYYRSSRWRSCYKPSPAATEDYFVLYMDVDGAGAEEIENNKIPLSTWVAANGNPTAFCFHDGNEIWGDQPYSEWWIQSGKARSDGNTKTSRNVFEACSLGDPNSSPTQIPPPVDFIKQQMLANIPDAIAVIAMDNDGVAGPEFIKVASGSGVRLDFYLRQVLGISPPNPPLSALDLDDPDFGGFFQYLYYDRGIKEELGIMDVYSEVNYGLMYFHNNSGSGKQDFPRDANNRRLGANMRFNLTAWANFDAYPATSAHAQNTVIQNYIGNTSNLNPSGGTPIASALHDIWRYFYYEEMLGYSPSDTNPSMFYDLGWPEASGSATDHVVQDDPFYINECRRNFLIFLTDGEQTDGEPLGYYEGDPSSAQLSDIISTQVNWITKLRQDGGTPESIQGVKSFFIGFGVQSEQNAIDQLNAMAAASNLADQDDDLITPLLADDPDQLMQSLATIMDSIMQGQYARTAPEVSASDEIILTSYFDVSPTRNLWRGHLLGWTLPEVGSEDIIPYWDPDDDLGVILNDKNESDREIFTAIAVSGNTLDVLDFDQGSAATLQPYMDPGNEYGATIVQNVIKIIRGTDDALFVDGTTPDWRLGPNFHSKPRIFKRPQSLEYASMPGYSQFMSDHANRPTMIMVGSGYGLLHVFDISDGNEIFGYVPQGVMPLLHYIYTGVQVYGDDGTPVLDDVYSDFNNDGANEWRTMLISGLGSGGTDYFTLDLTDASTVYDSDEIFPVWNFHHPKLGQTWSIPVMGLTRYGDTVTTAAFFGGGFKPDPEDVNVAGYFFIADMKDGSTLAIFDLWDKDQVVDLLDLSTLSSDTLNDNQAPGSPIILDADGDKFYDWAYIGDTDGRVWKILFHDPDPANWKQCLFYDVTDRNGDGTSDDLTWRRTVWYTPALAKAPDGHVVVYFATGHIEQSTAASDMTQVNHMFAVLDTQAPDATDCAYGTNIGSIIDSDTINWPLEFDAGEKIISQPLITDNKLIFKTYLPVSDEACSIGTVRLWALDYISGDAVWDFDGDGIPDFYLEDSGLSTTDFTLSKGRIWETCLSDDCLGEPIHQMDMGILPAKPMSWGEGIEWPY